jgi:hypothetical protein
MAEETKAAAASEIPKEQVVVSDVPVAKSTPAPYCVSPQLSNTNFDWCRCLVIY